MIRNFLAIAGLLLLSGCDDPTHGNKAPESGQADEQAKLSVQPTSQNTPEVHYSDTWSEMKLNPSSPEIAKYIEVAEPIDQKIGNAGAILKCGIQSVEWYGEITKRLEEYRAGPAVTPIFNRLTEKERKEAQIFDKAVVDGQMQFSGGKFDRSDCETLARAPFVYSEAAFEPGSYTSP